MFTVVKAAEWSDCLLYSGSGIPMNGLDMLLCLSLGVFFNQTPWFLRVGHCFPLTLQGGRLVEAQ